MKRKLGALCLAVSLVLGIVAAEGSQLTARQITLLEKQTDNVFLIRGEGLPSRVPTGTRLIANDVVMTGEKASAFFQADADRFFQLGASGTVAVTGMGASGLVLTLKAGELFFDILTPLGADETLDVVCGNTTMSIRGTSGRLAFIDDTTSVEIFTGKVNVSTGTEEYAVVAGSTLTLTATKNGHTAVWGVLSDYAGMPADFAARVNRQGPATPYEPARVGKPTATPKATATAYPTRKPMATAKPQTEDSSATCVNCGQKGLKSAQAHVCATCGAFTCGNAQAHGNGVCNTNTCVNCGVGGIRSSSQHLCKTCGLWTCNDARPHGQGICESYVMQAQRCSNCGTAGISAAEHWCTVCADWKCDGSPHGIGECRVACDACTALLPNANGHVCSLCGGYTCQSSSHSNGVCTFYCKSCGVKVQTANEHKCTYAGCTGYTCDGEHR